MFSSIISSEGLTLVSAGICILCSIMLGFLIAFIHTKGGRYSKNFVITLTILPLLVATVMIMVNGNLGTGVAIAGAFSLVRFRSMQGTSREIMSVFWAMAIGIAVGMGQILFAIMVTVIVSFVLIVLSIIKFGEGNTNYKVLDVLVPENLDYDEIFNEIFMKYTNSYELLKVKTTNLGSLYELRYNVSMKKEMKEKDMIDELRVRNGNLKISLHKEESEEML